METVAAEGLANEDAATGELSKAAAPISWEFPVFVGCRRRLPPDDVLFEVGNMEREELARQAVTTVAHDERCQLLKEADLAGDAGLADHLAVAFKCNQCHAMLPTGRLLELHVAELHDSFFAAQAARRLPVYQCLVEGCPRKFCTVEERKQHLLDHHKFSRHLHFDRIHIRGRRKAQIRPLPQYRKGHGLQDMAADVEPAPPGASGAAACQQQQSMEPAVKGGASAEAASPLADHHDDVVQGMSRLSMAAASSTVPNVIHFGRGRSRGLAGRPSRGMRSGSMQ